MLSAAFFKIKPKILGTMAVVADIGAVEGGIVFEATVDIDFRGLFAGKQHILCGNHPLGGDVLAHGGSGNLLESTTELGTADEIPLCQRVQRQLFAEMGIDVAQYIHFYGILLGVGRQGGVEYRVDGA